MSVINDGGAGSTRPESALTRHPRIANAVGDGIKDGAVGGDPAARDALEHWRDHHQDPGASEPGPFDWLFGPRPEAGTGKHPVVTWEGIQHVTEELGAWLGRGLIGQPPMWRRADD